MSETTKKPSDFIIDEARKNAPIFNLSWDSARIMAIITYLDEQHERAVKHVDSKECDDMCECGHPKSAHIYNEGACRPGFICPQHCKKYEPKRSNVENVSGEVEELAHELYKIRHPSSLVWKLETNKKKIFYSMARYVIEKYSKRPAKDVKYPSEKENGFGHKTGVDYCKCTVCWYANGWNACIEEMKRLNSSAVNTKELVELDEHKMNQVLAEYCQENSLANLLTLGKYICQRFGVPKSNQLVELDENELLRKWCDECKGIDKEVATADDNHTKRIRND